MRLCWELREARRDVWLYAKGYPYWRKVERGNRQSMRKAMDRIRERIKEQELPSMMAGE